MLPLGTNVAGIAEPLCDLLLRFPCSALEGVRWSVLRKVFGERHPEGGIALQSVSAESVVGSWLHSLAVFEQDGHSGDGLIRLRDRCALSQGRDGQLACWPLLLQRLGEIVRSHGNPQLAHALEVPHEDTAAEDALPSDPDSEVVGVLLAQLKPLLRRHWDPGFEERAIGFFNESGSYVGVKKMKHLVAELLRWRCRRRILARDRGHRSDIDVVLEAPMVLAVSQRHNDMVLCCPASRRPTQPVLPLIQSEPLSPAHSACPSAASSRSFFRQAVSAPPFFPAGTETGMQSLSSAAAVIPDGAGDSNGVSSYGAHSSESSGAAQVADAKWFSAGTDALRAPQPQLEKHNQLLRIENAELKKKLRFDTDLLNKEIRSLRIENAELKKRLYFPAFVTKAQQVQVPLQPVWLSAPGAFTPVSSSPSGSHSGFLDSPGQNRWPIPQCVSSGEASPHSRQGSLTPISQGYCYAVPVAQGMMSPSGQPWPAGTMIAMPLTPVAMGTVPGGNANATMSPGSGSDVERLLPKSLFSSDPASHVASDVVSPQCRARPAPATSMQFQALTSKGDDRWLSIPSGIVDRQVLHLQGPQAADLEGEEAHALPEMGDGGVDVSASSDPGVDDANDTDRQSASSVVRRVTK